MPPFATWHSSMDGCEASPMKIKRLIDILGAAFGLILMILSINYEGVRGCIARPVHNPCTT